MESIIKNLIYIFSVLLLLSFTQCAAKSESVAGLPDNILGVKIGMTKEDAEKHLREIGKFSRDEVKHQQLWLLRDNAHFGSVGIGYDKNNQVRFVTAIAKIKDAQSMRFTEVGDIKKAKEETIGSNHRYTWEVPPRDGNAQYTIIAQGTDSDYLSLLTLVNREDKNEEEDEEERGEKEGG